MLQYYVNAFKEIKGESVDASIADIDVYGNTLSNKAKNGGNFGALGRIKKSWGTGAGDDKGMLDVYKNTMKSYYEHIRPAFKTEDEYSAFEKKMDEYLDYYPTLNAEAGDESIPEQIRESLILKTNEYLDELTLTNSASEEEHQARIEMKMTAFLRAYRKAVLAKAEITSQYFGGRKREEKIQSFADVMGSIVNSNLKTSVRKLGRINAVKNRKKMNN